MQNAKMANNTSILGAEKKNNTKSSSMTMRPPGTRNTDSSVLKAAQSQMHVSANISDYDQLASKIGQERREGRDPSAVVLPTIGGNRARRNEILYR